ncbi:hypothetical protein SLEP1_g19007 [Rubroshorea leprosula]|nr:hypothetical protein SLEP1_g19007 [Rubroshorea leprosula]
MLSVGTEQRSSVASVEAKHGGAEEEHLSGSDDERTPTRYATQLEEQFQIPAEARELRGNQGREVEEGIISMEPIAMIVPLKLQDLLETITPKSSTSSRTHGDFDGHHSSLSKGSSSEGTPSAEEGMGKGASSPQMENVDADVFVLAKWEGKTINGRLSNIRKVPENLLTSFRFRVALHHDVADGAATVKRYKKLKEMVKQY